MRGTKGTALVASAGVLALLLLPHALAQETAGELVVDSSLRLPEGSRLEHAPAAFYVEDLQGASVRVAHLDAHAARVCVGEKHYRQVVNVMVGDPARDRWDCALEPWVSVQLAPGGVHAGWLSIYPRLGSAVTVSSSGEGVIERRASTRLVSPDAREGGVSGGDEEQVSHYEKVFEGSHLYLQASGSFAFVGPGTVKFRGPTLTVNTAAGEREVDSGDRFEGEGPVREFVERWVTVSFQRGTFNLQSTVPAQMVSDSAAELSWDGTLRFRPKAGVLMTSGGEYRAAGGAEAYLTGAFRATLAPGDARDELWLALQGTMRSTSLQRVAVPSGDGWAFGDVASLVVALAVAATSAAFAVRRLDRRGLDAAQPAPSAWSDVARADDAADGAHTPSEYRLAAELYARAMEESPDPRLARARALCLLKAGAVQAAMAAFDAAAAEDPSGDCDRWACLCALRLGHVEAAEFFLVRCLDRPSLHPEIVDEIVTHAEFGPLLASPSVMASIEAARQRRGREPDA